MKLLATDTSITVTFYSSKLGRRVETETGEPFSYTQPTTRIVTNAELAPGARITVQEAGAPGFTVEYTRRVWRGNEVKRDERFTTRYLPKDAIAETGPQRLSGE
jgi:exosome complex RNA-binding protein Rrp42 (RNase PH superfamily)